MIPIEKINLIIKKYESLEKELSSSNIDKKDFVRKSKEYSSVGEVINEAKGYVSFETEKDELIKIIDEKNGDKDMIVLAQNELNDLLKKKKNMKKYLSYTFYQKMMRMEKMLY